MTHQVLIVGAGFAGLGAAIRLRERGIDDIVILERAGDLGGTWRDNTYPGAACDIPSLLYSYSFEPNPDWSQAYSGSAEILRYLTDVADRHDLRKFIRFDSTVTGLTYDEAAGTWTAQVADGPPVTARAAVLASGALANPSLPDIPGLPEFAGTTVHSARWDHSVDFAGKRVAVVGTGASAVQIVLELVDRVTSLKVFQRTPGWVLPRLNMPHPVWLQQVFRRFPRAQTAARQGLFGIHEAVALGLVWESVGTSVVEAICRAHLRQAVADPWLRRQLTPDFRAGCKRMLVFSDWYPALQHPNCTLITWPIARINERGIRTADGIEHRVDTLVCATGFEVSKQGTPIPITGPGGRSLDDEWAGGAQAFRSVSVAGYPNLFLTFGPNSGPGHNSALVFLEAQISHLVAAIGTLLERDLRSLEVRRDRQERFNAAIQRQLAGTTWNSGCRSWYLTDDGHNATMYPGFATRFTRTTSRFDEADYVAS